MTTPQDTLQDVLSDMAFFTSQFVGVIQQHAPPSHSLDPSAPRPWLRARLDEQIKGQAAATQQGEADSVVHDLPANKLLKERQKEWREEVERMAESFNVKSKRFDELLDEMPLEIASKESVISDGTAFEKAVKEATELRDSIRKVLEDMAKEKLKP